MGFNKKYITEESIRRMATKNYIDFYKYFDCNSIILDNFSSEISNQIRILSIDDKDDILKIIKNINDGK